MALDPTGTATRIAALSVSGLTIRDLDAVPEEVSPRVGEIPVLYPDPVNFIELTHEVRDTLDTDAQAFKRVFYTLHYMYLFAPLGSERGWYKLAQPAILLLYQLFDVVLLNQKVLTIVNIEPNHGKFGPQVDPADSRDFIGCPVTFQVEEWVNA